MKHLHPAIEDVTIYNVLYGLSDPIRFQIIHNLHQSSKPLTCMDAVKGIENLPLSTRSHCFNVLRQSGLIRSEKKGRECYNKLRLEELEKKFPGIIETIMKQSDI